MHLQPKGLLNSTVARGRAPWQTLQRRPFSPSPPQAELPPRWTGPALPRGGRRRKIRVGVKYLVFLVISGNATALMFNDFNNDAIDLMRRIAPSVADVKYLDEVKAPLFAIASAVALFPGVLSSTNWPLERDADLALRLLGGFTAVLAGWYWLSSDVEIHPGWYILALLPASLSLTGWMLALFVGALLGRDGEPKRTTAANRWAWPKWLGRARR